MFEEILSELDTNQKIEIAKYAAIFAGGVLVGFSIKKVMDSYDLDVVKENAKNMVEGYINPKTEQVNVIEEDIIDEQDN